MLGDPATYIDVHGFRIGDPGAYNVNSDAKRKAMRAVDNATNVAVASNQLKATGLPLGKSPAKRGPMGRCNDTRDACASIAAKSARHVDWCGETIIGAFRPHDCEHDFRTATMVMKMFGVALSIPVGGILARGALKALAARSEQIGARQVLAEAAKLARESAARAAQQAALREANQGVLPYLDRLANQHVTSNGLTVLGPYPQYIQRAQSSGASYFDLGPKAWDDLGDLGIDQWAVNRHFLDGRIAAGGDVVSVIPNTRVRSGTYLRREIDYLLARGYIWIDDVTLRKSG